MKVCSTLFSIFNAAKVIGICNAVRLVRFFFGEILRDTYGTYMLKFSRTLI